MIDHERALTGTPPAVVLTFGGQTAIDLAKDLAYADVPIAGLTAEAIEITEDRERFAGLLDELGLAGPRGSLAATPDELRRGDRRASAGCRSSCGRRGSSAGGGSPCCERSRTLPPTSPPTSAGRCASTSWWRASSSTSTPSATATSWCVPGILEQIDPPGIHSGDSVAVLPPQIGLAQPPGARRRGGRHGSRSALGVRGILNVQMIVAGDRIVVIEANPRASRTVPIVAKATGRDVVAAAVRCALGASLAEVGLRAGPGGRRRARGGQGAGRLAVAAARRERRARTGDALDRRGARPRGRCVSRARAGLGGRRRARRLRHEKDRRAPVRRVLEPDGRRGPGLVERRPMLPQDVASGPSFRQRRAPSGRWRPPMPPVPTPAVVSKFRAAPSAAATNLGAQLRLPAAQVSAVPATEESEAGPVGGLERERRDDRDRRSERLGRGARRGEGVQDEAGAGQIADRCRPPSRTGSAAASRTSRPR